MGFLAGEGDTSTGSATNGASQIGRTTAGSGDIAGSAGNVQSAAGLSGTPTGSAGTSLNPNAQSSGVTAQNPNSPGGGNSDAMNTLINMKVNQPAANNPTMDAATKLLSEGAGMQDTYTPTGVGLSGGGASANFGSLLTDAKSYLGTPYEYGGTSKSGIDCSGFTQAVYASQGINIGRDTTAQLQSGKVVGTDGAANYNADVNLLQPGDLIFYGNAGASGPNAHVVMYIGGGQVIQAGGANVNITPLFSSASADEPFLGVRSYSAPASPSGGAVPPGGLSSWLQQAEAATGVNGAQWNAGLSLIAQHESSDNPDAINNWDSNAAAGHPSQGLMQTIPSTFAEYVPPSMAGLGIDNPVANLAAAINYIKARYGSIDNVPGVEAVDSGRAYVGY